MMIYRYHTDPDRFESLRPKGPYDLRKTNRFYKSKPMATNWKPFEVARDSRFPAGDFPSLYGFIPVFSERAWQMLVPLIADSVEALPIKHPSGKPYFAINVLRVVDCLDHERSPVKRYPTGQVMRVVEYYFDKSRLLKCHMFKIPESSGREVLVSDKFKEAVEEAKLKGLDFRQLYPPARRKTKRYLGP